MTLSMEEGFISEWLVKEGDRINIDDPLCNVENEKEVDVLLSIYEGTILKIIAESGDTYPVNSAIAVVGEPGEDFSSLIAEIKHVETKTEYSQPQTVRSVEPTQIIQGDQYRIMPKVRKLIQEKGIDIDALVTFCNGRRITEAEVAAYEQNKNV